MEIINILVTLFCLGVLIIFVNSILKETFGDERAKKVMQEIKKNIRILVTVLIVIILFGFIIYFTQFSNY